MIALLCFFLALLVSPFKPKSRLEAENVALRRQLVILRWKVRGRVHLTNGDRLFFVQLYRWFLSVLNMITIIRPETVVRWHRAGFRRYWQWKSRSVGGRPQIDADLRALIRRMSVDNPLRGAPRIHGELLKLGFEVAQSSVAKYMVKRCEPLAPESTGPLPAGTTPASRLAAADALKSRPTKKFPPHASRRFDRREILRSTGNVISPARGLRVGGEYRRAREHERDCKNEREFAHRLSPRICRIVTSVHFFPKVDNRHHSGRIDNWPSATRQRRAVVFCCGALSRS
jgi:hypothetical protein